MGDEDLQVRPISHYDAARYPHTDSRDGAAARRSLGGKLGAALLAATLGLTLTACDKVTERHPHPGPPPVRPDFKTERDAKKQIDKAKKPETATTPTTKQP